MKCVYLLFLFGACYGSSLDDRRMKRAELQAPSLKSMLATPPKGIEIIWDPVKSYDPKDPVIGYKVKIWEITEIKTAFPANTRPPKMTDDIPEGTKPMEFTTSKIKFNLDDVNLGSVYVAKVQAYTKSGEGPLSGPWKIKLGD